MDSSSARPPRLTRRTLARLLAGLGIALVAAGAVFAAYRLTYKDVTLEISGRAQRVESRAQTVGDLLAERSVVLAPGDMVSPAYDTPLVQGMRIAIRRAHVVVVEADGEVRRVLTQAVHPLDILREQNVPVGVYDVVRIDGHDYWRETLERTPWDVPPMSLYVMRSATLHVRDNGRTRIVQTTQRDIAGALDEAGIELYLADGVEPGFHTLVEDGMAVTLRRSKPVTIEVDGRTFSTRATGLTVGDVLEAVGVAPVGADTTDPPLEARFEAGMTIRVVRVIEQLEVEVEPVPFTTVVRPDFSLPLGEQRVVTPGVMGERVRQVRARYAGAELIERIPITDDITTRPQSELIAYGVRPG